MMLCSFAETVASGGQLCPTKLIPLCFKEGRIILALEYAHLTHTCFD